MISRLARRSFCTRPYRHITDPTFREIIRDTPKQDIFPRVTVAGLSFVGLLTAGLYYSRKQAYAKDQNPYFADIESRLDYIEAKMSHFKDFLDEIDEVQQKNPNNLMAKHFDKFYFLELSPKYQKRLLQIIRSGLKNPDSQMGVYAMHPTDYDFFKLYLDRVIRDYHKIPNPIHHKTNWELPKEYAKLDLAKLGLSQISMRVRVGRNLDAFPLPGAMTRDDRVNMEKEMVKAFKQLIADERFGGNYYSLTPGSDYEIDEKKYQELVDKHVMFKDMSNDSYLSDAGIASDWPYGRGCYVSADRGFIVWVGEEDHLRIMCMKKGSILNDVFDRLREVCDVVESKVGKFARSEDYGYVTSCPTNLGTGMRASVHLKVPNLTKDGEAKAKEVCKPLGLSVRGVGGEHTAIGADGTVDISPSARLCIEEQEIIVALYKGIELLLKEEAKAAKGSKL